MTAARVLVAFASQNGSTAGIAEAIAVELRDAGFVVDCLPAASVDDLSPYGAVILGSGVFLARRTCDGGGFIARHATELTELPVWLFSAGPIGGPEESAASGRQEAEAPVVLVAHAIGARGAAAFGTASLQAAAHDGGVPRGDWRVIERVRAWAQGIAADLCATEPAGRVRAARSFARPGHRPIAVTR